MKACRFGPQAHPSRRGKGAPADPQRPFPFPGRLHARERVEIMPDRISAPPQAGFRLLLARLDADDERAGVAFERIRRGLIKLFDWRGASWPEECADETLDRLAKKLEQGVDPIDVIAFAHGIARLVLHETLRSDARRQPLDVEPPARSPSESSEADALSAYLENCLDRLPNRERE